MSDTPKKPASPSEVYHKLKNYRESEIWKHSPPGTESLVKDLMSVFDDAMEIIGDEWNILGIAFPATSEENKSFLRDMADHRKTIELDRLHHTHKKVTSRLEELSNEIGASMSSKLIGDYVVTAIPTYNGTPLDSVFQKKKTVVVRFSDDPDMLKIPLENTVVTFTNHTTQTAYVDGFSVTIEDTEDKTPVATCRLPSQVVVSQGSTILMPNKLRINKDHGQRGPNFSGA